MSRLTKGFLPLFVLGLLATFSQAAPIVICTQTASGPTAGDGASGLQQGGCINSIPTSIPVLFVASDGEAPFQPFGAPVDTSDAIQLNGDWRPDPAFAAAFRAGFWTQIPGTFTWYLPAVTPCGSENEPSPGCEPIAKWDFIPGTQWNAGTPDTLYMLDANGSISDIILVNNTGPNGSAAITFASDPIPEPGTLTLLGLGLGFAAVAKRLRKKSESGTPGYGYPLGSNPRR